jgi:hypothetical protein
MIIYFQKTAYPSNINTYWWINAVTFKSGTYNAQALNHQELDRIISCLEEKFESIEIHVFKESQNAHAEKFRFRFIDVEDEDYFILLASNNGVVI